MTSGGKQIGMDSSITREKKSVGFFDNILIFSTFCLALYEVFPFFRSIPKNTYIEFLFFGMWLVSYVFARGSKLNFRGYLGGVAFFALYTISIPRFFDNVVLSNRYASVTIGFTFFLTYLHMKEEELIDAGWKIIKLVFPFYLFSVIRTIIELMMHPMAARSIKGAGEVSMNLLRQGVGGYQLIYLSVVVAAILMYLLLNSQHSRLGSAQKLLALILAVVVIRLIVLSNYFTALGIVVICLCLCELLRMYETTSWAGIFFFAIIFVVLMMKGTDIFIWILENIKQFLAEGRTLDRINITLNDLKTGSELSIFGSRDYTIEQSQALLKSNPLLGTCIQPGLTVGQRIIGVGQHSHFWDTLAFYGLPAGLLNVYLCVRPFVMKFREGGRFRSISLVVGAAVMILFYANNYTASICFAAYFVFPLIFDYLNQANPKQEVDRDALLKKVDRKTA